MAAWEYSLYFNIKIKLYPEVDVSIAVPQAWLFFDIFSSHKEQRKD